MSSKVSPITAPIETRSSALVMPNSFSFAESLGSLMIAAAMS